MTTVDDQAERTRASTCTDDAVPHRTYDAALARELLASTGELPSSKRALIVMLTEYRHALADLASRLAASSPAQIRQL